MKDRADVRQILLSGDIEKAKEVLRNPHRSNILYGFEVIFKESVESFEQNPQLGQAWATLAHDNMVRLAESIGAIPTYLPEVNFQKRNMDPDALIDALEKTLGVEISFPNIFPYEYGVITRRGIAGHRSTQAIYQAYRLSEMLACADGAKVLEIGAGLGRTAYYANAFGIKHYTIVDLPLANVAQAYFLGRTLGPDRLVLQGEPDDGTDRVRIYVPEWLWTTDERFEIAINVDSLTEMDFAQALRYWRTIEERSSVFISINHEAQSFRVADLPRAAGSDLTFLRFHNGVRKGYVEEIAFLRAKRINQELKELRQQIDSIQGSICWRLTLPIRWLQKQANRAKNALSKARLFWKYLVNHS